MCGIAGFMSNCGVTPAESVLDALDKALAHRGPDGSGRFRANNFAMIQRRLAIIDLAGGDQPLYEPEGAALVANAEIYDYIEQRVALDGATFATNSDCEVPLHLYRRDGVRFADTMRGMYAIALYDPLTERLLLARDPFGIKPLYYLETADGFAFASEPQALFAAGLGTARLNSRARDTFLQLQFTPGRETIYQGVNRVLPGETLVIAKGRIVERLRRNALPDGGPKSYSEADAIAALDAALEDSVTVHQRSDVPYGMFLSGGIDSSALLVMMSQLNDHPVRAFTVGFPDAGSVHDEREQAKAVAAALGADHVEVEFSEADFWSLLPKVAAALDDPIADYAALPTFKLAAAASDLKVVLTGEGGDELFAGYGRYRSALRPWWRGGKAFRNRGVFDKLGILREEPVGWRDEITAAEATEKRDNRSPLQVVQAVDCADWLPHDLLTKLDRCLMAFGVEGRTPLLDPAVAALAFRLPDDMKIRGSKGKWLLRRWLAARLPMARPFARKRGFTVPVAGWIANEGKRLAPLIAAQPGVAEVCRKGAVEKLFADPNGRRQGFAAWLLLFYGLWHQRHMLGVATGGDVFETLGERR
ncbi:MAG: asparagine synthase (glutamine-hydrolyzing) [Alphaproteobacteria bacterium]|jgi:asparagine synthase (glutamine-hydrolysing)